MKSSSLFVIALLGVVALAAGACGSGRSGAPCVENMPGMTMCSFRVPVPASPATHGPSSRSASLP
jgi:hypothetical protein